MDNIYILTDNLIPSTDQSSTAVSFSILSSSRKHPGQTCLTVSHCFTVAALLSQLDVICFPGWIIQPKQPSCDEPQWISLCQWVVERLQLARNPECVVDFFLLYLAYITKVCQNVGLRSSISCLISDINPARTVRLICLVVP